MLSKRPILNKQPKSDIKTLIEQFEEETALENYRDAFERELLYTLNQESEIICEEEYLEYDRFFEVFEEKSEWKLENSKTEIQMIKELY